MQDDPDPAQEAVLTAATFDNGEYNLSVPFLEIESLAEALRGACAESTELDVVEQAALNYLILVTGVSRFAEYRTRVIAAFDSSSITFTGSFERCKQQLKLGLGLPHTGFGYDGPDVRIETVRVLGRTFDWDRVEGATLQTCRVSVEIEFELLAVTDDGEPNWLSIAQRYRGLVESADRFMPQQRLNLRNIQVQ